MKLNDNQQAFIALVKAGLWEKEVWLLSNNEMNFSEVLRLTKEQSVQGLVATGLELLKGFRFPFDEKLKLSGSVVQIEQQNRAMNCFVAELVERMREAGINPILIKGQGIAQCYERPFWRASGDVDLLLCDNEYTKAKKFLIPFADSVEPEKKYEQHLGLTIGSWMVELHGNLRTGLFQRMDKVLNGIQLEMPESKVRLWFDGRIQVPLPNEDDDVVIVFTHILKHLFRGGIGLRQICDWCRLLWTCRDTIDRELLYERLKMMGVVSEWKVLASLAVNHLGLPAEAMPFYDVKYLKKANRILTYILESGNFGYNKDVSYQKKYSGIIRRSITLFNQAKDSVRLTRVFPIDAVKFFNGFIFLRSKPTAW